MNEAENYDVLIGIDRRGVAHVLKHRFHPTKDVAAEVHLTTTTVVRERYTTEAQDTGLVESTPTTLRGTAKRVAVDPESIRALLTTAAENGEWVTISGRKVDGTDYINRLVKPISVNKRPGSFPFGPLYALYCEINTGETRTFHAEGIERAEIVEIAS